MTTSGAYPFELVWRVDAALTMSLACGVAFTLIRKRSRRLGVCIAALALILPVSLAWAPTLLAHARGLAAAPTWNDEWISRVVSVVLVFAHVVVLVVFAILLRREWARQFVVALRCPRCEYSLAGNTSDRCPECGLRYETVSRFCVERSRTGAHR